MIATSRQQGQPETAWVKVSTALWLNSKVLDAFQAEGPG